MNPRKITKLFKYFIDFILRYSILSSTKIGNRNSLIKACIEAVPDISDQYTIAKSESKYVITKLRAQHSFQIGLAQKAIKKLEKGILNIVDIGDSSGTHLRYLMHLFPKKLKTLSVNIDPVAVSKIQEKGLTAIHSTAQDLKNHPDYNGDKVDIFLSFETLEHLLNPIEFLTSISKNSNNNLMVITVPYLAKSRVGLNQLRNPNDLREMFPENTHIFELNPSDWRLLFEFSGWKVLHEEIYLQYPPYWHPLSLTKFLWRRYDFEGFYGVVLKACDENKKHQKNFK
jgi:hypothetical protein